MCCILLTCLKLQLCHLHVSRAQSPEWFLSFLLRGLCMILHLFGLYLGNYLMIFTFRCLSFMKNGYLNRGLAIFLCIVKHSKQVVLVPYRNHVVEEGNSIPGIMWSAEDVTQYSVHKWAHLYMQIYIYTCTVSCSVIWIRC